jgi:hypothetical protein
MTAILLILFLSGLPYVQTGFSPENTPKNTPPTEFLIGGQQDSTRKC